MPLCFSLLFFTGCKVEKSLGRNRFLHAYSSAAYCDVGGRSHALRAEMCGARFPRSVVDGSRLWQTLESLVLVGLKPTTPADVKRKLFSSYEVKLFFFEVCYRLGNSREKLKTSIVGVVAHV